MLDQELKYDDVEEGRSYPPFDFVVTADNARDFVECFVVDALKRADGTPVEKAPASSEGRALSPFVLNHFYAIRAAINMPMGTLLARETIALHRPARAGDALRVAITVKSKQRKNEKAFVVLRHHITRRSDGAEIMDFDRTMFWPR